MPFDPVPYLDYLNPSEALKAIANWMHKTRQGVGTDDRRVVTSSTAAISLTGTNIITEIKHQSVTVTHNLGKEVLVTPVLKSIVGEAAGANFISIVQTASSPTAFTIRVTALFDLSVVNLTATLELLYW